MNLNTDMSLLSLITGASVLVQIVMALLLLASFISWSYIFTKTFAVRRAKQESEKFERDFWGGSDLNSLFQGATSGRKETGTLERIFEAGFREFAPYLGRCRFANCRHLHEPDCPVRTAKPS